MMPMPLSLASSFIVVRSSSLLSRERVPYNTIVHVGHRGRRHERTGGHAEPRASYSKSGAPSGKHGSVNTLHFEA